MAEIVVQQFTSRWPRLYLDTAVLNNIGRNQEPLADRLIGAMKAHSVVLVISFAHMRDALKPGDRDAPELMAKALEPFWMRGLVTKGPHEIEPWDNGPTDIEITPWGNVREFLTAPQRDQPLAEHNELQDTAFVADIIVQSSTRYNAETEPVKKLLSKEEQAIVAGSIQCLTVGLHTDAGSAIEYCANAIKYELTDSQRMMLFKRVLPMEMALIAWQPHFSKMTFDERVALLKPLRATAETAPGLALSAAVSAARQKNITRKPDRTDSVDLEHCTHLPYVDIATCDNNVHGAIAGNVAKVPAVRKVRLFRNGEVRQLIEYVEALPSSDAYVEEALTQLKA